MWSGAVPLWDRSVYTKRLALWRHIRLRGRLRWARLPWVTAGSICTITSTPSSRLHLLIQPEALITGRVYFNSSGNMWRQPFPVSERWRVHPQRVGVWRWGGLRGRLGWAAPLLWVTLKAKKLHFKIRLCVSRCFIEAQFDFECKTF